MSNDNTRDAAEPSLASAGSHGVALRDVFAAAAMAGMLARPDIDDEPLIASVL